MKSYQVKLSESLNDFKIYNEKEYSYEQVETFTKIPKMFIQCDLKEDFGISNIFFYVYCEINRNRTYENISYIRVKDIMEKSGHKINEKNKPKVFFEILKCLLFLKANNFIDFNFNIKEVSYNKVVKIYIITEVFDVKGNFVLLNHNILDLISCSDLSVKRENILTVYLYVLSCMFIKTNKMLGVEIEYDDEFCPPEAFWKSLTVVSEDIGMAKPTIMKCFEYLTSPNGNNEPIFIRRDVGSLKCENSKLPKNIPNIYVLNKDGYEKEIELALNRIYNTYNRKSFNSLRHRKKKKK